VLRLVHVFIHAVANTPAGLMDLIRSYSPSASAFPRLLAGRLLHLRFRGLLSVYLHYGLHDRQVAYATLYTEGSSKFVVSSAASIATGWSDPVPGWDLHPLWSSAFSRRRVISGLAISGLATIRPETFLAGRLALNEHEA